MIGLREAFAPAARSAGYRIYLAGRMVSVLGSSLSPVALAFAILDAGGGGAGLAYVLAAECVCYLAVMPVMGLLADRTHRLREALVASQIIAALFQASEAAIEEGRDLSSMSGILADTAYRLLLA